MKKILGPYYDILLFAVCMMAANYFWKLTIVSDEIIRDGNAGMVLFLGMNLSPLFNVVAEHTASLVSALLQWTRHDVHYLPPYTIRFDAGFTMNIVWGCTALKQSFIWLVIMLFARGVQWRKLWFIPLGWLVIYLFNDLRIYCIGQFCSAHPDMFSFWHDYFFKYLFYFIIFMLWVWWNEKLGKKHSATPSVTAKQTVGNVALVWGVTSAMGLLLGSCSPSVERQLGDLTERVFAGQNEPGAVVLVHDATHDICVCTGVADMEQGRPVNRQTLFNIASCSKQFTAVSVLQLVAAGKVCLNAPIADYFPEYTHPLWQKVTIAHLLSHSSGIPDARDYLPREKKVYGDEELATEYMQWVDSLHFEPGTAYEYINPTFVLLGQLVERVSGEPYTEYVYRHVLQPAGMLHSTFFDPANPIFDGHAPQGANTSHGYEYADVSEMPEERPASVEADMPKQWYEYDYGEETFFATRPDGGLYSSAEDLLRWENYLQAQMADTTCLARLLQDAMRPHTCVTGSVWSDYQNREDTWYGYGWFVEPEKGCIYHTGDNGGYKILIARYPKNDGLLIVLANRADWDRYAFQTQVEKLMGW
ncbi:MAG: serine hydrolase [Paludibacteraceae bacterium]|nr:serine hydrolase [Paludibacteraceae bacterium]